MAEDGTSRFREDDSFNSYDEISKRFKEFEEYSFVTTRTADAIGINFRLRPSDLGLLRECSGEGPGLTFHRSCVRFES